MGRLNATLGRTSYAGTGGPATQSPATASSPGATREFRSGLGDVTQGRVSLLMLDSLILLLVVFYVWTHRAQGGG
jgi:hypothetical protein